jgi:peroxiredoxin
MCSLQGIHQENPALSVVTESHCKHYKYLKTMKYVQILMSVFLIVIIGCSPKNKQVNQFNSFIDTLVFNTEKIKGVGLFTPMAGKIYLFDTTKFYKYPVKFPKNITDIKIAYNIIDFKKFNYADFHNKDKWNDPVLRNNSICIMSGQRGNDTIFIVDENNNKDFRDDSIRLFQKMDWKSFAKLIKIKYLIEKGSKWVEDSSWVNIGTIEGNEFIFVSHHLESTCSIDNQIYQIGVADRQSNFSFDEPILALISQNGIKKDTLLEPELLKKGEYLKLKDTYYRFDTISNDGKSITLIKEKDFNSKIGTQVGMIAPDFNCKSIYGDTISFIDYKGKYLLLVNISACWSPQSSYKCYKDLTESYKDKIEFLGIDISPVILGNNIKDLKLSGKFIIADGEENKMIKKYRPDYCSRTCFLINPEGRIVDKFEIFDWKPKMKQLFGDKK